MRYALTWTEATLHAVRDVTPGVREFEITPAGGAVRPFQPGAHLDIEVLVNGQPETRSYSLVGEAHQGRYRIAVKRREISRGGSAWMWSLAPGARLTITEPKTSFEIDFDHPEFLLVAGGIGITPLVGMAEVLARRGEKFRLIYSAREASELAFADTLAQTLGERLEIVLTGQGRRIDFAETFAALAPGALCALCGPMPMLEDAQRLWAEGGRAASDLRWETFGSSGRFAAEEFKVVLPRHGVEITVPRNRSLLDALIDAGIGVIADCRRGECGLCVMPILGIEGMVDHRDVFFSTEQKRENHKLCTCVSRAIGTLVLDTDYRPDAL